MVRLLKMPATGVSLALLLCSIAFFLTSCGGGSGANPTAQADFTLSPAPANINLVPGGTAEQISLSAIPVNGATGTIAAASPSLFQPDPIQPALNTLKAAALHDVISTVVSTALPGSVLSVLAGTAYPLAHIEAFVANADAAPNYILTASSSGMIVIAGSAGTSVNIEAHVSKASFAGAVKVTISGLPAGVTATPATLTLTPGKAQTVTIKAAASAVPGHVTFVFTGTSGTLSHIAKVYATITASQSQTPDYTLTASPATLSLTRGAAATSVSVKASAVSGFTGAVKVAISGLPTGVTASPASLTLTPGTAQSVSISAASAAALGTAAVTFTGTSGALSHVAKVYATITASQAQTPDYTLTASPATLSLTRAAPATFISVKASAVSGFTGTVKVKIGLPAGVIASAGTLTLTPGTAQSVKFAATPAAALTSATLTFTGTSGTLTHISTVAITISAAPVPSFTLSLFPATLTLQAGATGSPVSVTATAVNGFANTVKVVISGLPAGVTDNPASLTLTAGKAQSTTLTAASAASAITSTVTFTGASGNLTHSASLALSVQAAQSTTPTSAVDVTTYHYDTARDGLNAKETILTPANVNSTDFGKLGIFTLDGKVDAEPLYLANVAIGSIQHNILYAATEHGSLYAFDADGGAQLWKVSVIKPGETPSDNHGCGQIEPEIGITATPVIDRKLGPNGTIFVVAMSKDSNGAYHQRLHALDVSTGAEIAGSPTEITASYPGTGDNSQNGKVVFDPAQYAERAALLLLNGNIYTAWTSHCDAGLYTGWVMAYSETTLQQTQLINLTPNGSKGAIWMSGDGLAADSNGDIYLLDANGDFGTALTSSGFPANNNYGNAMVRLTTSGSLAVADYFETYNTALESDDDTELGSGGELILPDQKDAAGTVHHLIVGAGKDSNIYLADRTNLGKYNPSTSATNSNIYQVVSGALTGPVFSTPAYFNGMLYFSAIGDSLKAFPFTNARLPATSSSHSAATFAFPGATPAVSANGTQNGIVWAVESHQSNPGVLHAYDPTNLAHELYNSNQAPGARDSFGNGNKFITPLVVNGRVYIGTQTGLAVFGLLPH